MASYSQSEKDSWVSAINLAISFLKSTVRLTMHALYHQASLNAGGKLYIKVCFFVCIFVRFFAFFFFVCMFVSLLAC